MSQPAPRRPRPEANPHRAALVATQLEAALAERAWSAASLDGAPCFRVFFVRRGRAAFQPRDGAALELVAPQILWLPFAARGEFRLAAGGDGAALLASEDIVWRTIGENPLAAQLRPLLDRILVAAAGLAEIDMLFAALARESRDPGPGAPVMAGLYLGLLLMHLWREGGLARASDAFAAGRRPRSVSVNWSSCTIATTSASTTMRACSALRAPICTSLAHARSAARRYASSTSV